MLLKWWIWLQLSDSCFLINKTHFIVELLTTIFSSSYLTAVLTQTLSAMYFAPVYRHLIKPRMMTNTYSKHICTIVIKLFLVLHHTRHGVILRLEPCSAPHQCSTLQWVLPFRADSIALFSTVACICIKITPVTLRRVADRVQVCPCSSFIHSGIHSDEIFDIYEENTGALLTIRWDFDWAVHQLPSRVFQ